MAHIEKNSEQKVPKNPHNDNDTINDFTDYWGEPMEASPPRKPCLNIFRLEMTPEKPVINPLTPLQITLKCVARERQEVTIQVDSFLFKLLDPRAKSGTKTQIYHVMAPGETIDFHIGVMRDTPPGIHEQDLVEHLKTPEGKFMIYHQNTTKKGDTDDDWKDHKYDGTTTDRNELKDDERRIVLDLRKNQYVDHGCFEMEMVYSKETELIKRRKELFNFTVKRVKYEKERKEKYEKLKAKKEKKCCCTVL